jgi:protein tyrosine phosphatase
MAKPTNELARLLELKRTPVRRCPSIKSGSKPKATRPSLLPPLPLPLPLLQPLLTAMTKHSLAHPPPPTAQLSSLIHSSLSTRERTRRALCARQQQQARSLSPADYSASDARLPDNKGKNRYSDVLPYNKTRVRVEENEGEEGYVNASWIEEVDKKRRWIAAQVRMISVQGPLTSGTAFISRSLSISVCCLSLVFPQAPLPSTIPTFYSLLLPPASTPDTSTSTPNIVIQLTSLIERGILKAHPYLPTRSSPLLFFSPSFSVRYVEEEHHEAEGCVVTDLELTWQVKGQGGEQKKRIRHLFFGSWPDKGVPTGRDATGTLVR